MRGPARCGLVVLAAALGAACGDVRSIEPAVRDADAVEQPALVGRWVIPDTSQIDIARLPGQEPRYVLQTRSLEAQRDTADFGTDADSVTWFDARVGRVGGRLVLELKASERSDPTLARVARP